jgi:hypothetical protein
MKETEQVSRTLVLMLNLTWLVIKKYLVHLFSMEASNLPKVFFHTWFDNKVRELSTMCLLWQQWTETSV